MTKDKVYPESFRLYGVVMSKEIDSKYGQTFYYIEEDCSLRKRKRIILTLMKNDHSNFALNVGWGHNIDGLDETNRMLMENGFTIYYHYKPYDSIEVPKEEIPN